MSAKGTVYAWMMDEFRKGDARVPLYDWPFYMRQFDRMYRGFVAQF